MAPACNMEGIEWIESYQSTRQSAYAMFNGKELARQQSSADMH